MNPEIRSVGVEVNSELRRLVRARTHFALRRFALRVRHVTVRFVDCGGRTVCRVVAETRHAGTMVVEDADHDASAAASRAIGRLSRTMARSVNRARMAS